MNLCESSPLPRIAFLTALIVVGLAFSCLANAQIYGAVGTNGVVVLSNDPSDPTLHVIVAGPEPGAHGSEESSAANATAVVDTSKFSGIIAEASRNSQVPEELLRAVIAVESKFNPKAVSKKGARGLMQLMPQTAKRFSAGDMFDPRANVLAGAQYLRFLLDTFKGDIELAVAAYNAGENAVMRAGNRIPAFSETKLYVLTVMSHYRRLRGERQS
ncbi:lytic transglycosylase domain-containing protein [Pandoraea terrae]|nr:lytic transglycosylase domain-containing protein [Pandoraea terrae]